MNQVPKNNTHKLLKELGYEMNILLVEDDQDIQTQMKTFLHHFFNRVDTANNGREAMELYSLNSYDLVITDLTMPLMNGIELSFAIRSRNAQQKIIVVSAHSESEKLMELINIGVDGFFLKPIQMAIVMEVLIRTTQAIYDHKMVQYFNRLLEQTNNELKEANFALESTLNELQILRENHPEDALSVTSVPSSTALESFYRSSPPIRLEKSNKELEQIEDDFNLLLVSADRNTTSNLIIGMNELLRRYVTVLRDIELFGAMNSHLIRITKLIDEMRDNLEEMDFLLADITSLFDHLEHCRKGIFVYKNIENFEETNGYLIQKISKIENALDSFAK